MKILFVYESRIMFVLTHTHTHIYTHLIILQSAINQSNRLIARIICVNVKDTLFHLLATHISEHSHTHTHTHTQTQYLAGAITFIRPSNLNERMPTTAKRRLRHNCTAILLYRYFFTHVRFSAVAWLFAKRAMENRKSFNDFSTFSLAFFTFSICYFR